MRQSAWIKSHPGALGVIPLGYRLAEVTGELKTRFRIDHATIQLEPREFARHCAQASPDVL